jgi:glycosyltransferase involved in cell wall biosynthesis
VNVFWSFDPIRLFDPSLFSSDISVFHAVDKYLLSNRAEIILISKVDAFISVSTDFVASYQKYGKPILVKPHGVSADEFDLDEKEFKVEHENYILYLGTIDFRLDFPFISKLLKSFKNEKFVFLGGMRESGDPVFRELFVNDIPDNLIILPAVHAKKVKYFISKAKCCIAPMTKAIEGNLISHHKIFQYFTHGKAVFSPVFTEYLNIRHLIYMDNDENVLLDKMKSFLKEGENPELITERIQISKEHQYSNILREIFEFLNKIDGENKR